MKVHSINDILNVIMERIIFKSNILKVFHFFAHRLIP